MGKKMMVMAQAQKMVPKKGFKIIIKPSETTNKNSKNVLVSSCCIELVLNKIKGMASRRLYGSYQGVSSAECHLGNVIWGMSSAACYSSHIDPAASWISSMLREYRFRRIIR